MPAVKAIFLRISATWKAFRMVESMGYQFGAAARGALVLVAEPPILVDASVGETGCTRQDWSAVDDLTAAAGRLDALTRAGAEAVGVHGQGLAQLALGEHLHRHVLAAGESVGLHQLDRDLGAGVEAALERGDVHG